MNGNPNSKQWGPLGKFIWAFFIVGVLIYTRWWIGVVIFGAASILVMVLYALVTRGGGSKSAARERPPMRHTANGWERQGR